PPEPWASLAHGSNRRSSARIPAKTTPILPGLTASLFGVPVGFFQQQLNVLEDPAVLCTTSLESRHSQGSDEGGEGRCNLAGERGPQAASSTRRSANARICCLVGRPDRAS